MEAEPRGRHQQQGRPGADDGGGGSCRRRWWEGVIMACPLPGAPSSTCATVGGGRQRLGHVGRRPWHCGKVQARLGNGGGAAWGNTRLGHAHTCGGRAMGSAVGACSGPATRNAVSRGRGRGSSRAGRVAAGKVLGRAALRDCRTSPGPWGLTRAREGVGRRAGGRRGAATAASSDRSSGERTLGGEEDEAGHGRAKQGRWGMQQSGEGERSSSLWRPWLALGSAEAN